MASEREYVETVSNEPLAGPAIYSHVAKLGDMVVQLPRIRFLARRHGAPVHVVTRFSWCGDLLKGIEYIDSVSHIGQWRVPFWLSPLKMQAAMAMRKAGAAWFYAGEYSAVKRNRFMLAFAKRTGVPANHIFPGLPEWYNPIAFPESMRPDARDAEPPALPVFPGEKEAIRAKLREAGISDGQDFIIAHTGCSYSQRGKADSVKNIKAWHSDNWIALLKMINAEKPDLAIVMTGSGGEREAIARIIAGGVRAATLANRTSVRELIALASAAHSCISIDTGMAHIATTSGCPLAVLFAAGDPRYNSFTPQGWGPAATIRGLDTIGKHVKSIDKIRPETVFRVWEDLPPRPDAIPKRCVQKHYVEGRAEPELVETQIARILTSQKLIEKAR